MVKIRPCQTQACQAGSATSNSNPARKGQNPTLSDTNLPGRVSRVKCQPFQAGSKSNPARHQPARQGQQDQIPTGQPVRVSRVKSQPCQAGSKSNPARHMPARQGQQGQIRTLPGRVKMQPYQTLASQAGSAGSNANPSRQGQNPTLPDTSQPGRVSILCHCILPGEISKSSVIGMYLAWYDFKILCHGNVYSLV
jgi:hypothetical protein